LLPICCPVNAAIRADMGRVHDVQAAGCTQTCDWSGVTPSTRCAAHVARDPPRKVGSCMLVCGCAAERCMYVRVCVGDVADVDVDVAAANF